jgi:hypothetical protein
LLICKRESQGCEKIKGLENPQRRVAAGIEGSATTRVARLMIIPILTATAQRDLFSLP